ncbi:hypothetical protein KIN20_002620 [Parelaphostrongylus tenuis]|uniref:Uncharacterized protein n=1 Tax=Parelaphostrongylus tenuis TaxID=148309 RepID=A0AAD5LYU3_PARTN|nr:hypothetical protein KIN20_002620 [Parelaphostrongylus tenuis]
MLRILLLFIPATHSLTCYNGMKMVSMQSVGQGVEECPAGAYCYNMTASAAFVVDLVKAGCSTWRCMLARDKCLSLNINFVPVSFCCCDYDRCNVAENAAYGALPSSGSNGGWGGSSGSGGGSGIDNTYGGNTDNNNNDNNNNNRNNYNGWGNNNDNNDNDDQGSSSGTTKNYDRKQIEDHFKNFDPDRRDDGDAGEEAFERVDVRYTTPSSRIKRLRGSPTSGSLGREIELDD